MTKKEKTKKVNEKLPLDKAKDLATSKLGLCTSNVFENKSAKLNWICKNGHSWQARYTNVVHGGQWCPHCKKNNMTLKDGLERANKRAEAMNGVCLSDAYISNKTSMEWSCDKGHIWNAPFKKVVTDCLWCPTCYHKDRGNEIEIAKKLAKSKNGLLMTDKYKNAQTRMQWVCAKKHTWEATYVHVLSNGTWCPYCNKTRILDGILNAQNAAKAKGGECLSNIFNGSTKKLLWRCGMQHEWRATYSHVINKNTWCPTCSSTKHKSESRVRCILETFFGFKLPSKRPSWNRNPLTKYPLELDGYNHEFKIAFEHDGEHHFGLSTHGKYGHKNQLSFRLQIYRDYMKKVNCEKNGITLLNIPIIHANSRNKFFLVLRHVIKCCQKYDFNLKFNLCQIREMRSRFYSY